MINKLLIPILLLSSVSVYGEDFIKAADNYVRGTHVTAKNMATALFTNKLIEAYLSARQIATLDSQELESLQKKLQENISSAIALQNEAPDDLIWDVEFNKKLLSDLYELRSALIDNISAIEANKNFVIYQNEITKKSILEAFNTLQDTCTKGLAVSPLNAGQSMPALLQNSYNIQIQWTYGTDAGKHSYGGMVTPEAPRGSPEVNAAITTGMMYGAYAGGPVGWAVVAGLASVQYLYNSEEKRKADIEMSDALMRTIDNQARSEDVRRYYQEKCAMHLPIFKKISDALKTGNTGAVIEIREQFALQQKENLDEFKIVSNSNDTKALGKFLTEKLRLDDLVEIAMVATIDGALTSTQQNTLVTLEQTSLNYYRDVLDALDQRIRKLQSISYQLSLLAQDQNILKKIRKNSAVTKEIYEMVSEWNGLFANALAHKFGLTSDPIDQVAIQKWLKKYHDFKEQNPMIQTDELDRHFILLVKVGR